MPKSDDYMSIGQAAGRCGVATSTLRFYESRGLIQSHRGSGNQRRYHRSQLRKISLIKIAQSLGISLSEIGEALEQLPSQRTPTKKDWEKLSSIWRQRLDERIANLQNLRERLSGCIGCGCLSMQNCELYNAGDQLAQFGPGPRYLLSNR